LQIFLFDILNLLLLYFRSFITFFQVRLLSGYYNLKDFITWDILKEKLIRIGTLYILIFNLKYIYIYTWKKGYKKGIKYRK